MKTLTLFIALLTEIFFLFINYFFTYNFLYSDIKLVPIICPAATDARFIRSVSIPAIGFSPINNTPILAHAHDEYIEADMYLKGIEIFKKVISNLANLD